MSCFYGETQTHNLLLVGKVLILSPTPLQQYYNSAQLHSFVVRSYYGPYFKAESNNADRKCWLCCSFFPMQKTICVVVTVSLLYFLTTF